MEKSQFRERISRKRTGFPTYRKNSNYYLKDESNVNNLTALKIPM